MGWIKKEMINKVYILFFIFSCGFYSTKGSLPAHIKSIYINSIINESSEATISSLLLEDVTNSLIDENIIEIVGQSVANSRLDITIMSVKDAPNIYGLNTSDEFNQVDEWKIVIDSNVKWIDLINGGELFSKNIKTSAVYGTSADINSDGIDNDGDNLIDSNDDDEFGPPREGAIRISIEKLSRNIISQITSTW
tara:strand:- start:332 stop:913 length:582 start_codon:yes stop_codon:yes gene_type:complete